MSARREAILSLARSQIGVSETDGPNNGPEIRFYLKWCVRKLAFLHLGPSDWCAAFVSWAVWVSWSYSLVAELGGADGMALFLREVLTWSAHEFIADKGPIPIGYRAAVSELVKDARGTGRLHLPGDGYTPSFGDLAVFARIAGESPLTGGRGHVAFYVGEDVADPMFLGGNQGDGVRVQNRKRSEVIAWIDMS